MAKMARKMAQKCHKLAQFHICSPYGKRHGSTFPDKLNALAWLAENKKAIEPVDTMTLIESYLES
ncbi:hypothetical protein HMPREF2787_08635 [Corynebacterium sp. HMSC061H03]|nr:hypothetical protein HMPREF2787_08635 [Corynebacterium sp. HMSC061H03]